MKLSLIVAMGKSRQIGKDNKMLWHISEDFKLFKKTTMGKVILMGRKTFDSIGRPLPGRTSIVVTRNKDWSYEGVHVVHSLQEGIDLAIKLDISDELVICGGGNIYTQAMPLIDTMYLSLVDFDGEADTFFPDYNISDYKEISTAQYAATQKSPKWDFIELEKDL